MLKGAQAIADFLGEPSLRRVYFWLEHGYISAFKMGGGKTGIWVTTRDRIRHQFNTTSWSPPSKEDESEAVDAEPAPEALPPRRQIRSAHECACAVPRRVVRGVRRCSCRAARGAETEEAPRPRRRRGFAPWTPEAATLQLLDKVRAVLGEYEDYLPLTIRQIFYRLVGKHRYEKTEQAYENLAGHLNRARRARLISFAVIRDDTSVVSEPDHWTGAAQFWATIRHGRTPWARRLRDLIEAHISDLGGASNVSASERSLVRRASTVEVELERMEVAFARAGAAEPDALDLYQRTVGNLRRVLESLGLRRRPRDVTTLSLASYLAEPREPEAPP
jgi:hypothetical protein